MKKTLARLDALWRRSETTILGWWMVAAANAAYTVHHLSSMWPQLSHAFGTLGLRPGLLDKIGAVLLIAGCFLVTPRDRGAA